MIPIWTCSPIPDAPPVRALREPTGDGTRDRAPAANVVVALGLGQLGRYRCAHVLDRHAEPPEVRVAGGGVHARAGGVLLVHLRRHPERELGLGPVLGAHERPARAAAEV